jgi:hypothetical protein
MIIKMTWFFIGNCISQTVPECGTIIKGRKETPGKQEPGNSLTEKLELKCLEIIYCRQITFHIHMSYSVAVVNKSH